MEYSRKQKQLDIKKWVDSEAKNYDTCGEYDYCKSCDKSLKHPCAHAYEVFSAAKKLVKETTATKKTTAKKTTTKKATTTCKRTTKKATAAC